MTTRDWSEAPEPGRRLAGKVALVSGASSGIGAGVVQRFVQEGASVVAIGRDRDRLGAVCEPFGERAMPVAGDITDYAFCAEAVGVAVRNFGRLDILVSNAGIYDQKVRLSDLAPHQIEHAFEEVFSVNVKGAMLLTHAALRALKSVRGNIIFTGSVSSLAAGFGGAIYIPSKHALLGLARHLALELAGQVRVNSVLLGYVDTGLRGATALGGGGSLGDPCTVLGRLPTGFVPRPQDTAGLFALLASERDGGMLTGAEILADSGQSMLGPPAVL